MGGALFSLCYLTWGQTMVDIIGPFEGDGSFKMSHACTAICSTRKPAAGHCQPMPLLRLLDTHGQVWVNLFWGHCSFLLGPGAYKGFVHPPRVCFPVLGKFWQFYGGVNDDLLQEGLYHTQVYCTQSPCPCSSPLLTHTSTGNTQTQFCLSLRGVSGSWCTRGLFEPSESLWWVWFYSKHDFTPPTILPGLLLCSWMWGISSKSLQGHTEEERKDILIWMQSSKDQ